MNEHERIVCEFLRKIAPLREWEYIGEVEHYWIGELCNELNKQLKEENAKLRELVRMYDEYTNQDRCEGCVYKTRCNDGLIDECWQLTEIRGLARELGIEVD